MRQSVTLNNVDRLKKNVVVQARQRNNISNNVLNIQLI